MRSARRYKTGRSGTKSVQRSTAPAPITFQRDVSTVYRRRRMPRGKKRKWIGLKRRVNAVIDKRLATHVLHLSDDAPLIRTTLVNQQTYYGGLTLYDYATRTAVAQAVDRLQPEQPELPVTNAQLAHKHVIVGSMNNLVIKNLSEIGVAYIDVYYWRAKRDVPRTEFTNIELMFASGFSYNVANYPVGGNVFTWSDVGATPWANPAFRKFIEIRMKRRIRLSAGSDTELSLRSPRNFYNSGEYFQDQKSMIRWKTEGIFLVFRGDPYIVTSGDPPVTESFHARSLALQFSRQRTIYYKVLQDAMRTAGEQVNVA